MRHEFNVSSTASVFVRASLCIWSQDDLRYKVNAWGSDLDFLGLKSTLVPTPPAWKRKKEGEPSTKCPVLWGSMFCSGGQMPGQSPHL